MNWWLAGHLRFLPDNPSLYVPGKEAVPLKQLFLRIGAKIVIATFMTIAGGILVGAILLRSLLFHPETLQPVEPDETSLIEK